MKRFLKKYRERGSIERKAGSGRKSVLVTDEVRDVVEEVKIANDETDSWPDKT